MPLRARLPSPGALFMFEAAARHQNFTLAAREFNVTQPAISRMISRLEQHLGTKLFLRRSTGLELTEEGRVLQRAVRQGFDRIEEAVCDIQAGANAGDVVTLSVTSAFAIHWLMPHFDKFRQDVPGVQIRLDLIHGEPYGSLGAADIGVRYAFPEGDEIESWPLVEEVVIPVCSPGYLHTHGPIDGLRGLKGHILASLIGKMRIPWPTFLAAVGLGHFREATELAFSDYALVIQGAIKGQAIALGWWHVVAGEVLSGGLVPAGRTPLRTGAFYHLVARRSAARRPEVQKVRDWLRAEFMAIEDQRVQRNLFAPREAVKPPAG
ncbi:LysR family transcriptional regulator [Mesorhizobium sp. BH1-1-5]|uniref:LysR substrate-binding domain-containing protein n=1 Tax=Mesorhizobium sp. BH1-1-5 TaxID=2876661 RepID=UPI001CC95A58|nr:LysR substrate-binding domain-containing protein [Mesorhizobium sp. BH1-1-5]MBZ9991350.1 LysR family transcriptional regulator [Mesorhizobium sp. BH1-1-5]